MKYFFYSLFSIVLMLGSVPAFAQIGMGTTTPAPSAALEVTSSANNKGILIPRITATQKDAIVSPAEGLLIYQTTAPIGFYYYMGTAWNLVANATDLATASAGGVPYTGATGAVNLGAYDLKVNDLTVGKGGGNIETNTAIGNAALIANTTGARNTANGTSALENNTTGGSNTANGTGALYANTTGGSNTANGISALQNNTTGGYNTANGAAALKANKTGNYNTANGVTALFANTTGNNNTANGEAALFSNTTGAKNTANGSQALYVNTTGEFNTANGMQALLTNTTGSNNTANGMQALVTNTTGASNTAIGYAADVASAALTNATAIGAGAKVSVNNTIQLGNTDVTNVKTSGTITTGAVTYPKTDGSAGQVLTAHANGIPTWAAASGGGTDASTITGIIPVAKGGTGQTTVPGILYTLGFASNNVAIGSVAGTPNQGVNANTIAIGGGAGRGNQGAASVAIGYVSGDQNQGSASVAIGSNAAQSNQGTQAVALGFAAGQNGQGAYSVAVGSFAGNSQAANSIALNATGASLNPSTTGFFVDPIINRAATSTALYYNTTTKEITSGGAGTHTIGELYGGGIVFYVTPDKLHGLIAETQDQHTTSNWFFAQNEISISSNHSTDGKNYTDWRLPTKNELNLLYEKKVAGKVGVFADNYYWSSTGGSSTIAFGQNFFNGYQYAYFDKAIATCYVRAVRAF